MTHQSLETLNPPSLPFDLGARDAYENWREAKLAAFPASAQSCVINIRDLAQPSPAEIDAVAESCARANMAIFTLDGAPDVGQARSALPAFAAHFGLDAHERHRSAADDGVVALEVSSVRARGGFIPYTDRPLNWHTDGYYNDPSAPIRAFILFCVRQAPTGGDNQLLDPDIAYIRLRDENPALVAALMHPRAMTIPAHAEDNGDVRPASVGPVFSIDAAGGALVMRYTARTRNIAWRDDADTAAAVAYLDRLLRDGDPLIFHHRLEPGQGLICNNVLHNRTRFEDAAQAGSGRLLYRMRFDRPVAPVATFN
jgi:alpha-ketoglutarate-dependent taurine dioxygenase